MSEKYNYNLSGSDRKPLVEAISQILDKPAVYQGAPSFSYIIGDFTVDRNGVLSYSSNIHPDYAAVLVEDLRERGFVAERIAAENDNKADDTTADADEPTNASKETATAEAEATDAVPEESLENNVPAEDDESAENSSMPETVQSDNIPNQLTVEVPIAGFTPETLENLKKIIASKATLLKQALEIDNLSIVECDGKITFPWFTLHGLDGEADAYNRLVAALCKMAKNQKRVTATEKPIENGKYTMRLFLIRLGFIGDEYKTARRILLRNLTGNSSWKSGHKPERLVENTITDESIEPVTALAADEPEESPDSKGGEQYGKE